MAEDMYEAGARYYDAAYAEKNLVDRDFYLDLAREFGGPILEMGCGTGRITLPVAREGIAVTGVDFSPSMLEVLRRKLDDEQESVRRAVQTVDGDFRTLELAVKFPLVMIPFRPMQHMYTIEDQLAALTSARRHLTEQGVLAFDVFNPRLERVLGGVGEEFKEMEWPAEDGSGRTWHRYFIKDSVDTFNLSLTGRFTYRLYEGEQLLFEEVQPLKMSFYTYPHLKLLFAAAGLQSIREFGSFEGDPIGPDMPEMIFVLGAIGNS